MTLIKKIIHGRKGYVIIQGSYLFNGTIRESVLFEVHEQGQQ